MNLSVLYQQVVMENGSGPESNTSLTSVPHCQSTALGSNDTVTSSAAHRILQYGSRHTIQNTGWTTRLCCDASSKRNSLSALQKLQLPPQLPLPQQLPPLSARRPFLSISKPTVLTVQPSMVATAAGATDSMTIQVVDGSTTCPIVVQSVHSSVSCVTPSSVIGANVLQNIVPKLQTAENVLPSSSVVNAVLTVPTIKSHIPGKPTTVCFIPVSSVICAPVSHSSAALTVTSNMADVSGVTNLSANVAAFHQLNLGTSVGSRTVVTNAATKPFSSISALPAKEMLTGSYKRQGPGVRMMTVNVHIDHGHITEVREVLDKQTVPQANLGMITVHASDLTSAVVPGAPTDSHMFMDHVDANGAQFGYHDLMEGIRIRIALDTSGQRHAPFFLLPKNDDQCPFEESVVEVRTDPIAEPQVIPEEADVSEVGTVFTYEPLFVSEQTLVPIPRKRPRPHDSTVGTLCSEDKSDYAYKCYLCSFVSDDHSKVCRHWVNVHLVELPYRCFYCGRTFFTSTRAQVHVQRQHGSTGVTKVAFQRSDYFVNTLSYELGESDADDDEHSDSDEKQEPQIVLEQCRQWRRPLQRQDIRFTCQKCNFKAKSPAEMHQHLKFVHGSVQKSHSNSGQMRPKNPQHTTDNSLQADIMWSDIWEELNVGNECWFQCRWCAFREKSPTAISVHILQEHNWPSAVLCPSCACNVQLSDADRHARSVICYSCRARVLLVSSSDSSKLSGTQAVVYVCNICSFKTQGKDSMCRHIKYNHTKCRPYSCVYCNYVAVERTQVKMHITNHHPDKSVLIKQRSDDAERFNLITDNLFSKIVSLQTSEGAGLPVNIDDDCEAENDVSIPFFTCTECKLETLSLQQLIRHQRHCHQNTTPAFHDKSSAETPVLPGEHFRCKICGYCCLDRSCMSRHVKYMHITARPHSCTYCSYNNVEKTKVRLHIIAHHPGRQKAVRTDRRILEEMSWQAKHFYIRIDSNGDIVEENASIVNRSSSSPADRPVGTQSSDSDSELVDNLLNEQSDAYIQISPLCKEEEMLNDEDDDVDLDFHPVRNGTAGALFNSVCELDHSYARISVISDGTLAAATHNGNVVIKEEPLDMEYEECLSSLLSTNGSASVKPELDAGIEVKNEPADLFVSNAASLSDSFAMSEDSDEFFGSENSCDFYEPFDSEHSSDSEVCSDIKEPVKKKIRVAFGVDPGLDESMTSGSIVIDSDLWDDPKMHMTPVVELEDVLQIILAWQQNIGESEDIL